MDEKIRAAAQVGLSRRYESEIRLLQKDVLVDYEGANSHIYRCSVQGKLPGDPGTVVVKYAVPRKRLMVREWVAYKLLSRSEALSTHLLQQYFIEPALEFSVMEDMGDRREGLLGEILFQNDRSRAEEALMEYARLLALTHTVTVGRQSEWQRHFNTWNGAGQTRHKVFILTRTLDTFGLVAGRLGRGLAAQVDVEIKAIRELLEEPGPFLALSHGDSTPANFFYRDGHAWIFDWETSGYRHCLLDGALSHIRDLHSVWARDTPKEVRWRMYDAYQETLAAVVPAAADEALYSYHFAGCCLAWLGGLLDFHKRVIEKDVRWGRSTLRQRIFTALLRILDTSMVKTSFPGLYGLVEELSEDITSDWHSEDCLLPHFPVFT